MTKTELFKHIKINIKDKYDAAIVVAALYKKIYGEFPKIGLSGMQAECAELLLGDLPDETK